MKSSDGTKRLKKVRFVSRVESRSTVHTNKSNLEQKTKKILIKKPIKQNVGVGEHLENASQIQGTLVY